jgi:hypothetical protein
MHAPLDVTAEDILTQYKFPHCWKQLNYIIMVQISIGQVSYFLIPVVSSFQKINYKRSLFNFKKKLIH